MLKIGKYACTALSCLCCGLMGAAGATLGEAALKFHTVARLVTLGMFSAVATLAWVMYNLPSWLDSAHHINYLPSFVGCGSNATGDGGLPTSTQQGPGSLVDWLLQHEFGSTSLSLPERLCYGASSAHRVMFALTLFHVGMAIMMVGADRRPSSLRYQIQHGWWILKLLAIGALILFTFFSVSNDAIVTYSWVAIGGSALFILAQLLLFIEFAYKTNATLAESYSTASSRSSRLGRCTMGTGLMVGTLAAYAFSIAFIVLSYASYEGSCPGVAVGITGTLVLVILSTAGSAVAYKTRRGGLFPAAIVALYGCYLTWSALSPMAISDVGCTPALVREDDATMPSSPNATSIPSYHLPMGNWSSVSLSGAGTLHDMSKDAQNIVLMGAAILALGYATFRTASGVAQHHQRHMEGGHHGGDGDGSEDDDPSVLTLPPLGAADAPSAATPQSVETGTDSVPPGFDEAPYSFATFHFILALACMYAASIITGFNALQFHSPGDILHGVTIYVNHTAATLWVKFISSYFLMFLFTIVVYAGFCCRCLPCCRPPRATVADTLPT